MNSLLMFFSRGSWLAFGSPPWSLGMFGQPCHKNTRLNHAHKNTAENMNIPAIVRVGVTLDSEPSMFQVNDVCDGKTSADRIFSLREHFWVVGDTIG
jgi:hypothetical protein